MKRLINWIRGIIDTVIYSYNPDDDAVKRSDDDAKGE